MADSRNINDNNNGRNNHSDPIANSHSDHSTNQPHPDSESVQEFLAGSGIEHNENEEPLDPSQKPLAGSKPKRKRVIAQNENDNGFDYFLLNKRTPTLTPKAGEPVKYHLLNYDMDYTADNFVSLRDVTKVLHNRVMNAQYYAFNRLTLDQTVEELRRIHAIATQYHEHQVVIRDALKVKLSESFFSNSRSKLDKAEERLKEVKQTIDRAEEALTYARFIRKTPQTHALHLRRTSLEFHDTLESATQSLMDFACDEAPDGDIKAVGSHPIVEIEKEKPFAVYKQTVVSLDASESVNIGAIRQHKGNYIESKLFVHKGDLETLKKLCKNSIFGGKFPNKTAWSVALPLVFGLLSDENIDSIKPLKIYVNLQKAKYPEEVVRAVFIYLAMKKIPAFPEVGTQSFSISNSEKTQADRYFRSAEGQALLDSLDLSMDESLLDKHRLIVGNTNTRIRKSPSVPGGATPISREDGRFFNGREKAIDDPEAFGDLQGLFKEENHNDDEPGPVAPLMNNL